MGIFVVPRRLDLGRGLEAFIALCGKQPNSPKMAPPQTPKRVPAAIHRPAQNAENSNDASCRRRTRNRQATIREASNMEITPATSAHSPGQARRRYAASGSTTVTQCVGAALPFRARCERSAAGSMTASAARVCDATSGSIVVCANPGNTKRPLSLLTGAYPGGSLIGQTHAQSPRRRRDPGPGHTLPAAIDRKFVNHHRFARPCGRT